MGALEIRCALRHLIGDVGFAAGNPIVFPTILKNQTGQQLTKLLVTTKHDFLNVLN